MDRGRLHKVIMGQLRDNLRVLEATLTIRGASKG